MIFATLECRGVAQDSEIRLRGGACTTSGWAGKLKNDKVLKSVIDWRRFRFARLREHDAESSSEIEMLMRSATRTLPLTSPYFIPGNGGMAFIRELSERGVDVIVLTNFLGSPDVIPVFTAYRSFREKLLRIGVQLDEFLPAITPGEHLYAKALSWLPITWLM